MLRDSDAAREFLELLFPDGRGYIDVSFMAADGPRVRRPRKGTEAALEQVAKCDGDNCYVGVASRKNGSVEEGAGGKINLLGSSAYWVDVDVADPTEREQFLKGTLAGFMLPPSFVVMSGGGLHVYWLLEEPTGLKTEKQRETFEAVLKGLCDALHADRSATDSSRILRVPGTDNVPPEYKRLKGRTVALCEFEQKDNGHRYTPDDFDAFEERGRALMPGSFREIEYTGDWDGKCPAEVLALVRAKDSESELSKRWSGSLEGLGGNKGDSELDLALANWLAVELLGTEQPLAWIAENIEYALRWRRQRDGAKPKHAGYYPATIGKAIPWAEEERDRADEIQRKAQANAQPTLLPNEPNALEDWTEDGIAERFARLERMRFRFLAIPQKWLQYDGQRWAMDETRVAVDSMRTHVRSIYEAIEEKENEREQRELEKTAPRIRRASVIKSALLLAGSDRRLVTHADDFDTDHYKLNVQNGLLDLKSGELQGHTPEAYCRKLAPVAYDPDAEAPMWKDFLERVLPDPEVREYVQRMAGYCMTGSTTEEAFFLMVGTGQNGKTTFVETIRSVLGDYTMALPEMMLMRQRADTIPNDVARLPGVRLGTISETQEDRGLNEERIKALVSGDRITARFLHGEFFEFQPVAKYLLATNHQPEIRGTDEGIWRRVKKIAWDVQIPDAEKDPDLRQKLTEQEGSGILAWLVRGCLDWQAQGLGEPDAVKLATREYRTDQDLVGEFLTECCNLGDVLTTSNQELSAALKVWAERNGHPTPSPKKTAGYLKAHGFRPGRTGQRGRFWHGFAVRPDVLNSGHHGHDSAFD
jgi:P4 family phage/plasmid primase-like protien